jgi:hypothetical protein
MSEDSRFIFNFADIHSFTDYWYKTVNCEQLICSNIHEFMQFVYYVAKSETAYTY